MKRLFFLLASVAVTPACAAAVPPTFSIGNVTVPEGGSMGSSAVVTVTKSAPAKSYSRVEIRTGDGTARAGVDYTATDVSLTFANNELTKRVSVPILNDSVPESTETFSVAIIPQRFAIAGAPGVVTITDDDVAPSPPPPPLPAPSVPTTGEPDIADNYDVQAGIEPQGMPIVSGDAPGAFRLFCTAGPIGRIDPLVYPGQVGVSHLHQFLCNSGVTENSTYLSLRTSGGSTSGSDQEHPGNRSAYWYPAMLDGVGHVVPPLYGNIYYKRNPASDPMCRPLSSSYQSLGQCVGLPNGLRFVFAYNMKDGSHGIVDPNNSEHWSIRYECWGSEDGKVSNGAATGRYWTISDVAAAGCPVGARLMILVNAPNCWDGKNIDSADHRSHMAWGTGAYYPGQMYNACPADHPYVIPAMSVQLAFHVDANLKTWRLSSDEMVAGAAPGSTFHMDYWEAWSPALKATWTKYCIDAHMSCSSGALGNGTGIKGNDEPIGGWPVPALVPIP